MKTLTIAVAVVGALAWIASAQKTKEPTLDDGQVAGIVQTYNEAEIAAARAAQDKAKSVDVKAFARMMLQEHMKNNQELASVSKQSGIEAKESETSQQLRAESGRQQGMLGSMRSQDFERGYIDQQVEAHKSVLATLDRALKNGKREDSFMDYLRSTREAVQVHLEHAETLQSKLKK